MKDYSKSPTIERVNANENAVETIIIDHGDLRDQFAMAALTGLLLNNGAFQDRAKLAYEFADAMMEARK